MCISVCDVIWSLSKLFAQYHRASSPKFSDLKREETATIQRQSKTELSTSMKISMLVGICVCWPLHVCVCSFSKKEEKRQPNPFTPHSVPSISLNHTYYCIVSSFCIFNTIRWWINGKISIHTRRGFF